MVARCKPLGVWASVLILPLSPPRQEWHKSCFNCRDCKRPLDSTIACDGPDKDIYCKTCYARRFGPKGFGFGHTPTLVSGSAEEQVA